jgi:2-hydroxymuconate-semialdehyde hydrolase
MPDPEVASLTAHMFEFEGVPVSYTRVGAGQPLLLLHGSGPGASSLGNWRLVMGPLSEKFEVFAMDLIGFGLSGRKPIAPYFDFDMWVRQAAAMLDHIGAPKVGVIGHSLSGALALTLASRDTRVAAVLTTASMGARFEVNEATRTTWTCPRDRAQLLTAMQNLIQDHSLIDEAYLAAREPIVFAPGYADYFDTMFEGDQNRYVAAAELSPRTLAAIGCEVLMLHGRDDRGFPPEGSVQISAGIDRADLVLLHHCSHSVAFEHRQKFLDLATAFFAKRISSIQAGETT